MPAEIVTPIASFTQGEVSTESVAAGDHIVAGTDFSDEGRQALDVAAEFAERYGNPLLLIHAVNEPARGSLPNGVRHSLALFQRKRLYDEVERLRSRGAVVADRVQAGSPDEVLSAAAAEPFVRLLVLAPGGGKSKMQSVGSVTDRVVAATAVPTLVVRSALPILSWLRGKRTLKVFIAADLNAESEAAIRWGLALRALGKCDISIAHVEGDTLPTRAPDSTLSQMELIYSELHNTRTRLFGKYVRRIVRGEKIKLRVVAGWGPSDAHLIHLAKEEDADLIVTGTHHRRSLERLFHHSVSRGLLHYAPMSVACIPSSLPATPTSDDADDGLSRS